MPFSVCHICGREFSWSAQDSFCSFAHQEEGHRIETFRVQLEAQYEVQQGRITCAGMFANAEIFVPYFVQQIVTGRGFQTDELACIEINRAELRVFPELNGAYGIALSLSIEQGIRYVVLQTQQEFDEAVLLEMAGLPRLKRPRAREGGSEKCDEHSKPN